MRFERNISRKVDSLSCWDSRDFSHTNIVKMFSVQNMDKIYSKEGAL
jgi:hypothetical protein